MGDRTTRPHAPLRACRTALYIVALAVLAWLAGAPVLAQTGPAQVERVIDGDTITVRLDGVRDTVRLTGVNTPETRPPTQGVEPYGPQAGAYTTVRLVRDPADDQQDADGRIRRHVILASGVNGNATLRREGYGTVIRTFPYSRQRERLQLDTQARRARQGRWADPERHRR